MRKILAYILMVSLLCSIMPATAFAAGEKYIFEKTVYENEQAATAAGWSMANGAYYDNASNAAKVLHNENGKIGYAKYTFPCGGFTDGTVNVELDLDTDYSEAGKRFYINLLNSQGNRIYRILIFSNSSIRDYSTANGLLNEWLCDKNKIGVGKESRHVRFTVDLDAVNEAVSAADFVAGKTVIPAVTLGITKDGTEVESTGRSVITSLYEKGKSELADIAAVQVETDQWGTNTTLDLDVAMVKNIVAYTQGSEAEKVYKAYKTFDLGITQTENDLALPSTDGTYGTALTWTSNNKNVISDDGRIISTGNATLNCKIAAPSDPAVFICKSFDISTKKINDYVFDKVVYESQTKANEAGWSFADGAYYDVDASAIKVLHTESGKAGYAKYTFPCKSFTNGTVNVEFDLDTDFSASGKRFYINLLNSQGNKLYRVVIFSAGAIRDYSTANGLLNEWLCDENKIGAGKESRHIRLTVDLDAVKAAVAAEDFIAGETVVPAVTLAIAKNNKEAVSIGRSVITSFYKAGVSELADIKAVQIETDLYGANTTLNDDIATIRNIAAYSKDTEAEKVYSAYKSYDLGVSGTETDLTLPSTDGTYGTVMTWTSSDTGIITDDGKIEATGIATLTCKIASAADPSIYLHKSFVVSAVKSGSEKYAFEPINYASFEDAKASGWSFEYGGSYDTQNKRVKVQKPDNNGKRDTATYMFPFAFKEGKITVDANVSIYSPESGKRTYMELVNSAGEEIYSLWIMTGSGYRYYKDSKGTYISPDQLGTAKFGSGTDGEYTKDISFIIDLDEINAAVARDSFSAGSEIKPVTLKIGNATVEDTHIKTSVYKENTNPLDLGGIRITTQAYATHSPVNMYATINHLAAYAGEASENVWGVYNRYNLTVTEADKNLELPTAYSDGTYSAKIIWSSSHKNIISASGVYNQPRKDTDVTLTARIESPEDSNIFAEKAFIIKTKGYSTYPEISFIDNDGGEDIVMLGNDKLVRFLDNRRLMFRATTANTKWLGNLDRVGGAPNFDIGWEYSDEKFNGFDNATVEFKNDPENEEFRLTFTGTKPLDHENKQTVVLTGKWMPEIQQFKYTYDSTLTAYSEDFYNNMSIRDNMLEVLDYWIYGIEMDDNLKYDYDWFVKDPKNTGSWEKFPKIHIPYPTRRADDAKYEVIHDLSTRTEIGGKFGFLDRETGGWMQTVKSSTYPVLYELCWNAFDLHVHMDGMPKRNSNEYATLNLCLELEPVTAEKCNEIIDGATEISWRDKKEYQLPLMTYGVNKFDKLLTDPSIDSENTQPQNIWWANSFDIYQDTTVGYDDNYSMTIQREGEQTTPAKLFGWIGISQQWGKRPTAKHKYRLTAMVKTEDCTGEVRLGSINEGGFFYWDRITDDLTVSYSDSLTGTNDWTELTYEYYCDGSSDNHTIFLEQNGSGKVWVDNFTITDLILPLDDFSKYTQGDTPSYLNISSGFTATVENVDAVQGNALKLVSSSGGNNVQTARFNHLKQADFKFKIMYTDISDSASVSTNIGNTTNAVSLVQKGTKLELQNTKDGSITLKDDLEANKWYDVEVLINNDIKSVAVKVDNKLLINGFYYKANTTSIADRLYITTNSANTFYIDDLEGDVITKKADFDDLSVTINGEVRDNTFTKGSLNATLKANVYAGEFPAKLMIAKYKNGTLDSITIEDTIFNAEVQSVNEISLSSEITETEDVTYQILAWEDMNNLIPLTNAVSLIPEV